MIFSKCPQSPVPTRPESVRVDVDIQDDLSLHAVSKGAQLLDSVTVGSTGRLPFLGYVPKWFSFLIFSPE